MIKRTIFLVLFIGNCLFVKSQELNCQVQIVHRQIQGTNVEVFRSMQKDVYEFMNTTRWTDHVFSNEERIECTIFINLTDQVGSDRFKGTIQVQSRRPVYNTNYNTVLLNHKERDNDFHFEYIEQQPLEFNETRFISNLTSVLAFYAYVIIGLDYDSFSMDGGAPFFQKALTILNLAQSTGASGPGWQAYENLTNRYWIIENLTNDAYKSIHEAMYRYHRMGLDRMSDKTDLSRTEIAESLELIRNIYRKKSNAVILDIFFNSKGDELVKVFSDETVPPMQKKEVYNILKEIDVGNSSKYESIIK